MHNRMRRIGYHRPNPRRVDSARGQMDRVTKTRAVTHQPGFFVGVQDNRRHAAQGLLTQGISSTCSLRCGLHQAGGGVPSQSAPSAPACSGSTWMNRGRDSHSWRAPFRAAVNENALLSSERIARVAQPCGCLQVHAGLGPLRSLARAAAASNMAPSTLVGRACEGAYCGGTVGQCQVQIAPGDIAGICGESHSAFPREGCSVEPVNEAVPPAPPMIAVWG